jgi:hypothetical protein
MSGVALMGQPLKVELASEAKRAAEAATAVRHLPPCGQLQCFLCPGACLFCAWMLVESAVGHEDGLGRQPVALLLWGYMWLVARLPFVTFLYATLMCCRPPTLTWRCRHSRCSTL